MEDVLNPFALVSRGLNGPERLRSIGSCSGNGSVRASAVVFEFTASIGVTTGVVSGDGDCSCISTMLAKGALCGSGDRSMPSVLGPAGDEGTGGVVTKAALALARPKHNDESSTYTCDPQSW